MIRKLIFALTLIVVLGLAVVPAFAQEVSRTYTKTEAQINSAYRVTNPIWRSLTNAHVDLQEGQIVISATYTTRRTGPVEVVTTLIPYIENGRLFWEASSASANGEPVSDAVLRQINNSLYYSWVNFWRRTAPLGHVSDVQITEDAISVTFTT